MPLSNPYDFPKNSHRLKSRQLANGYEIVAPSKAEAEIQKKKMPKLPVKKTMQDRDRFSFLDAMSQFGSRGIAEANSILSRSGVRKAWGGFETTSGTNVNAIFNFVDETWKATVSFEKAEAAYDQCLNR